MKIGNCLILVALAVGLFIGQSEARASQEDAGDSEKVCFCHNINHHPHTICTADEALIQAHMDHVNGEVPGVEDSLGECSEEEPGEDETPTYTPEPTDGPEEPADEVEIPTDDQGGQLPETDKVDGFDAGAGITDEVDSIEGAGPAGYPSFEGSGGGCSLAGPAAGSADLIPWALFAAAMFLAPSGKSRK